MAHYKKGARGVLFGHNLHTEKSHNFHKICRSSTNYVVHQRIVEGFELLPYGLISNVAN